MLKIGCAYAKSGDGGKYTVCNYGPGGNMAGANIYAEGEPASKCPEGYTPDDGLCGKGGNNGGDGGYEGSGNNSGGDGGNEGSGNNGAAGSSWDNSVPKYTTTNEMQEDPSGGGGGGGCTAATYTEEEKKAIVDEHNEDRRKVSLYYISFGISGVYSFELLWNCFR